MAFKQIKYKIGLIIFVAFLCGLGALLALTHWSIKRQFLNFTSERTTDSLIPLESLIVNAYSKDGNLDRFQDNQELWKKTTQRLIRENIRRYRRDQSLNSSAFGIDANPRQSNPASQRNTFRDNNSGERTNRSPERNPARSIDNSWEKKLRQNQRMFMYNLGLYDTNLKRIVGIKTPPKSQKYYPITYDERKIAYIGYTEPREFTRDSEFIFWNQQIKSFWILSLVMFALSLIASSIIARKISKPLSKLSDATKRLADGDRVKPIISTSEDEIGQLCEAFNKMSRQLESNESARKRWVADISHEMRTPLAVLKAQIEAIEDGIRPANKENLALLSNKIAGINHLIDDLYELSLYDADALSYNKNVFSITDHIENFALENQDIFIEKNLNFHFYNQCYKNTPPNKNEKPTKDLIFADEHRIDQLLNNIMQNSLRYTSSPGSVEWLASGDEKNITITMRDSGPGLDHENLEFIFDRLYRAEASRNKETGGAGLGLSICKSIVTAHDGKIWAEPSLLGGVQIKIKLPIHLHNNNNT